jgi:phenylacetic acid degradation operon negative regulatory protein
METARSGGMSRFDYAEVLDLFCWGMDQLTRPTLGTLLGGYRQYAHRHNAAAAILRLEKRNLIQRTRTGKKETFTITAQGRRRLRCFNPEQHWSRSWDGAWRVVTFDLPERRRADRKRLWQALRARKLGFLQRSVWIWPHDVRAILNEIIKIEGLPECFCGFQANVLFLCTTAEVVATAWDWEEIGKQHQSYLQRSTGTEEEVAKASALATVTAVAQRERHAYQYAFLFDPLLSRTLLPKTYRGFAVEERHQAFRRALARRFFNLAPAECAVLLK